ncbi:MAG: LpxI family protein [Xanthobacteraceae bacterium]
MASDAPGAGEAAAGGEPVAIICGGGSFPGAVAEAIERRGRRPVMFAVRGWADPKVVERYPHHWIAIGQAGRFFRLARAERCREGVFIGTLLRPGLTQIRLDWQTLRLMPRIARVFRGGDDRLLSGIAALFEEGGLRIIGVEEVAPEIVVPAGTLGRYAPSPRDRADIAYGLKLVGALGPFDIGQAAVVADGHVVALEAAEGTDNMLMRVAQLRSEGRFTKPPGVGVLVKAPKPGQDRRFDLPAIGPKTVENVARAGLAGLAVAAGSAIVAEPAKVSAAADREKIFFVGVSEEASR